MGFKLELLYVCVVSPLPTYLSSGPRVPVPRVEARVGVALHQHQVSLLVRRGVVWGKSHLLAHFSLLQSSFMLQNI